MAETGIPGDVDPEREMLVEVEIASELAAHERERAVDRGARRPDLVDRMRRFELHPIDPGLFAIGLHARDRIVERAAGSVARIALRHHDKIGVEFVLHIDRGAVARDRLIERHDIDPGVLGLALALDRLVVDADAGQPGADAVADQAAHGHDPAMPGVAVDHHRDRDAVGDPAGDRDAFAHRRGADIGKPGIGADHPAGADEQRLAPGLFHDPGMRRARRVQHGQHLVGAVDQLLEPGCARAGHDAEASLNPAGSWARRAVSSSRISGAGPSGGTRTRILSGSRYGRLIGRPPAP